MKRKTPFTVFVIITVLLFAGTNVYAQKKAMWEVTPKGGFSWMRNTSLGNVIISTATGLQGIDPATGKITWTITELAFAPEQTFEEISNTPFIAISPKESNEQLYIIEPFEGKILFSSRESNISRIVSKYFLYQCNAIIVVGYEAGGKEPVIACIDMGSGKKLWSKSSDFSRLSACVAVSENEMVLSTLFFAYKINVRTGAELWKQSIDPAFAKMGGLMSMLDKGGANLKNEITALLVKTDFASDLVFMGAQKENRKEVTGADKKTTVTITYESFYNAFKISNGAYAWAKPVVLGQKLGTIIPCKQGLVVCGRDRSDVNMLDYNSGEGKWGKKGKGIDVKGGAVSGGALIDDKVLLTSGDKDNYISMIDPATGENKFPKGVKIDGQTQRIVQLPKGILIATNEEVDFINSTTGESLFEKPFKSSSSLVQFTDEAVYLFNKKDGLLYSFSKGESAAKAVNTAEIKFEGKEQPAKLEIMKEGILLSSDQNMCLVDASGKTVYKKYFVAPRESGFKRALLYASAVRAAYYSVAFGYTSAVFGATSAAIEVQDANSKLAKDITADVSQLYGNATVSAIGATGQFMKAANKRFTATMASNDFMYILTEAGKKEYHLVKVAKATGEVADEINLGKDKEPKYELDYIENVIYYEQGGKIIAYKL